MTGYLTRRNAVTAAAMPAVLALAACGTQRTETVQRAELTGTVRIITFHGGPPGKPALDRTMDAFRARYPSLNAELIVATPDYWVKLAAMINGGDPPDVVQIGPFEANSQFRLGNLLNLKNHFAREQAFARDLAPNSLTNFRVGGEPNGDVVVVPEFWTPYVIFFNKAMFRSAGAETPMETYKKNPDTWTFDTLLNLARRLSVNTNPALVNEQSRWGFQVNFPWTNWLPWMWSHKGGFLSRDGKTCTINSAECVQAIQFIRDLVWRHNVAPTAQQAPQFRGVHEGKVAMVWNGGWDVARLTEAGIDFGIAPPPKGPGGRFSPENAAGYGIHPKAKNPDAAWAFLRTRTDPEVQKQVFGEVGYLPVSRAALAAVKVDEAFTEAAKQVNPYESARTTNWSDIGPVVLKHWGEIVTTDVRSVRDGVESIVTEVNAILRRSS